MVIASVAAIVAKPTAKLADERVGPSLDHIVPKRFGDWREEPLRLMQVVNPQTQELLDKLYSEILTRVYVNSSGYRIMLSLAYGSEGTESFNQGRARTSDSRGPTRNAKIAGPREVGS